MGALVGRRVAWPHVLCFAAALALVLFPGATETAVANGDTRTISLYHAHTHETISATYMVDGQYDQSVLDRLNHFLRDWRNDDEVKMDPRLFDTVWEVYRESGSQQPIEVMSAYRSPQTNAMLRRRSRQVAEHSQHILGRAMDQHYMDVPMSRIRELGMKLQRGGVGFYPTSGTPFVHLDVGGVRHWPRMSYDQLARLFPDGKTVHIPSNGQPLPGYEQARAELESRGDGNYPTATELKSKGFFAWLFGGGGGDEQEDNEQAGVRGSRGAQHVAALDRGGVGAVQAGGYGKNAGGNIFAGSAPSVLFPSRAAQPQPQAPAQPAADPHETLGRAMVADARGSSTPARAAAPVAELPVPAKVLDGTDPTQAPTAPLPPRRPVELAAQGPGAPVPPSRPAEFASLQPHDTTRPLSPGKPDAIGAILASNGAARLPDVITQGTQAQGQPKPSAMVLSYAYQSGPADSRPSAAPSPSVPLPVSRPPALVSAHLDRSNFRSLTHPAVTERSASRSTLGSVLPPVRAAARSDLGAFLPVPSARPTSFQSRASDLATDHFSGLSGGARTAVN